MTGESFAFNIWHQLRWPYVTNCSGIHDENFPDVAFCSVETLDAESLCAGLWKRDRSDPDEKIT